MFDGDSECPRHLCTREGEWRAGYNGYCCLEHRDYDEYEQQIKTLEAELAEVTEDRDAWQASCSHHRPKLAEALSRAAYAESSDYHPTLLREANATIERLRQERDEARDLANVECVGHDEEVAQLRGLLRELGPHECPNSYARCSSVNPGDDKGWCVRCRTRAALEGK